MDSLKLEIITEGNVEICRDLCNELMVYQKSQAVIATEAFDAMSFDTRMAPSAISADAFQVIVLKDEAEPVGYIFSTIETIEEKDTDFRPSWGTTDKNHLGFYPPNAVFPQTVGVLKNLYIRQGYRHLGWGGRLVNYAHEWFAGYTEVKDLYVYISNGNDTALSFYQKHGYIYSHDVFGGFIIAAVKQNPGYIQTTYSI